MKIIGNTVGTTIPKPNLLQDDPRKGDYVKGKEEFLGNVTGGTAADNFEDHEFLRVSGGHFKKIHFSQCHGVTL